MKPTVLVLLVALGCGGRDESSKPADGSGSGSAPAPVRRPDLRVGPSVQRQELTTRDVPLDEPVVALPRQDSFALLGAGAAPRAPLRYRLASGVATYQVVTQIATRHIGADAAWTAPLALPTIRDGFQISTQPTNLQLRPLPLAIDGTATPDVEQATALWRTAIADHRAHADIDDRGQLANVYFNDDPATKTSGPARDELVQRLLATVVPVPAEPIGKGASWRVVTVLRQGGAYIKQTATYTLTGVAKAGWTVDVALDRVGEQQRIPLPGGGGPGSAASYVELVALVRHVRGTLAIDPTHPIGTGKLATDATVHARIVAGTTVEQLVEDTGTSELTTLP